MCVYNQQDLQMFDLKLDKYELIFTHLKLWVALARHY